MYTLKIISCIVIIQLQKYKYPINSMVFSKMRIFILDNLYLICHSDSVRVDEIQKKVHNVSCYSLSMRSRNKKNLKLKFILWNKLIN